MLWDVLALISLLYDQFSANVFFFLRFFLQTFIDLKEICCMGLCMLEFHLLIDFQLFICNSNDQSCMVVYLVRICKSCNFNLYFCVLSCCLCLKQLWFGIDRFKKHCRLKSL